LLIPKDQQKSFFLNWIKLINKLEKLNEIIQAIQRDISKYFDSNADLSGEELQELKTSLLSISCSKDIDVIYAMLKPGMEMKDLEENKENEEDNESKINHIN